MRLVLLGAPGAGKGTQAEILVQRFGVPHISTGDMLRDAIRRGTAPGKAAEAVVASGRLVPDDLVRAIVEERLDATDCQRGFVLDGYPRNVAQASELEEIFEARGIRLDRVIELKLAVTAVVERLSGRRTCMKDGIVYHVTFNPPRQDGVCDRDGSKLVQREDDREDVVRRRLEVYESTTAPLVAHYRGRGLLTTVSAEGSVEEVARRLEGALACVS